MFDIGLNVKRNLLEKSMCGNCIEIYDSFEGMFRLSKKTKTM